MDSRPIRRYAMSVRLTPALAALLGLAVACTHSVTGTGQPSGSSGGSQGSSGGDTAGGDTAGGTSGDDTTGGSTGTGGSTAADAQRACLDFVDAAASAYAGCGYSYGEARDTILQQLGGDCIGIVQVRDETALRTECIPWFQAATCAELDSGPLPAGCEKQFSR